MASSMRMHASASSVQGSRVVHLGQAAAAETMNVFDLVGANPPTDVDRFLREIGDDLVQPFERGIRSQET